MQEKIEAIRQACIKANPGIVELKFGCEIETTRMNIKGEKYMVVSYNVVNKRGIYDQLTVIKEGRVHSKTFGNVCNNGVLDFKFEIIGRKIGLADVLHTIAKTPITKTITSVSKQGSWIKSVVIKWNLLKDDITLQSEETINFIHSLLEDTKESVEKKD